MKRTDLRKERVEAGRSERRALKYSRRKMRVTHTRMRTIEVATSV